MIAAAILIPKKDTNNTMVLVDSPTIIKTRQNPVTIKNAKYKERFRPKKGLSMIGLIMKKQKI